MARARGEAHEHRRPGSLHSDYCRAFAKAGFEVSGRKLEYDGYIPFVEDGWTPDFADALNYYTETKIVFRLIKRRNAGSA